MHNEPVSRQTVERAATTAMFLVPLLLLAQSPTFARGQESGDEQAAAPEHVGSSEVFDQEAFDTLRDLTLEQLLDVEVESVSLRSERVIQAPGVVSIISGRSFRTYQYESIADALRVQPDVDVLYDHSSYNAGVRGVNAGWGAQSKVFKLMLDRQDIGFHPTAGAFLGPEAIPLFAIRRVEVIRGPLSALYGANAFLGVINLIPQTAESMSSEHPGSGVAKGSYINAWGNHGGAGEAAQWWRGEQLDLFGAVSLRSVRRDGLALPRSSPRYDKIAASGAALKTRNDLERTASAYLRGAADLSSAGEIMLDGLFQYSDRSGNFDPDSEPMLGARLTYYNATSRIRYELQPSEPWTLQASLGISSGGPTDGQRLYDPFRPGIDRIERPYAYLQGNGSLSVSYERASVGSLTLGADALVDHESLPGLVLYEESGAVQRVDSGRTYNFHNQGAFIQSTLVIAKNLTGLAGARYEHHNLYGAQLNYRGVLVYSFTEGTSIKALYGSAFQAPSPVLLFGGEHPRLTGINDNSDLQPQYVRSAELAFTTHFTDAIRMEIDAYYNRLTDFAELDTVTAGPQATNRTRVDAIGGSLQVDVQPARIPLNAFANVSYVRTDVGTDELPTLHVSRQTRLYPALKGNLGASYTIRRAYLRPFATFRWIGRRAADKSNLVHLPPGQLKQYYLASYGLLDVGLSSSNLRLFGDNETLLSIRATNVLDTSYAQPGFAGASRCDGDPRPCPSSTRNIAPNCQCRYALARVHNALTRGSKAMKKFLVLYKAPTSSFEQMMKATPEQQKAGMDAWMAWSNKAAGSILDMGAPLGKSVRATPAGSSPTTNDLGGYSILQAESSEALATSLKGHPHFMTPDGTIEIVEVMPMPGM